MMNSREEQKNRKKLSFWKGKFLKTLKDALKEGIIYTIKSAIVYFIEEKLIQGPLKKIMKINEKWGWGEDGNVFAF